MECFSHDLGLHVFIQNSLVTVMAENNIESKTLTDIFEKSIKQFVATRESFLPLYIKNFSDGHREYNNYIEQMFQVMRTFESKFYGKTDEPLLKIFEDYTNEFSKLYLMHVDATKKTTENYLETRLSIMASWNDHMKKFTTYQK